MSAPPARRTEPTLVAGRWKDLFQPLFQDMLGRSSDDAGGLPAPAIDVSEDASALRITAELPGLKRRDIDLHVKNGVLSVRLPKREGNRPRGIAARD